uniref:Uncharacterized protein n=1 Tax=Coccidioides posadasii RMSCC 3488 TaxID=454284 RepID=A0A0J6F6P5_COCPO|nr:hypothetical protein CPAG_04922 [Coccidioides posadasii RMSCC 3488]
MGQRPFRATGRSSESSRVEVLARSSVTAAPPQTECQKHLLCTARITVPFRNQKEKFKPNSPGEWRSRAVVQLGFSPFPVVPGLRAKPEAFMPNQPLSLTRAHGNPTFLSIRPFPPSRPSEGRKLFPLSTLPICVGFLISRSTVFLYNVLLVLWPSRSFLVQRLLVLVG